MDTFARGDTFARNVIFERRKLFHGEVFLGKSFSQQQYFGTITFLHGTSLRMLLCFLASTESVYKKKMETKIL